MNQSNPNKIAYQKLTASASIYALEVMQMQYLRQKMPENFKNTFKVIYKNSKLQKTEYSSAHRQVLVLGNILFYGIFLD